MACQGDACRGAGPTNRLVVTYKLNILDRKNVAQTWAFLLKALSGGITIMRAPFIAAAALAALLPLTEPVVAQSSITSAPQSDVLLESYDAYIGQQDLFNSSGRRLTKPWQIVRQDRANFHMYRRGDRYDDWDTFFGDPVNREMLEQMLRRGFIAPQAARDIVQGDVLIRVEIYGRGRSGHSVHISVTR